MSTTAEALLVLLFFAIIMAILIWKMEPGE
jgi:hypothetical protein